MSINVNSITDSYNAWYDYKYGNNTRGLTADDIAQIETRWKSNLASWKTQAEKDENKYEITDDDVNDAKQSGKEQAADKTGHNGKADTAGTVGASVLNVAAGAGGVVGGGFAAAGTMSLFEKSKQITDCAEGNRTTAGKCVANAAIMAGIATAMYAFARIIRGMDPNGEQAKALEDLRDSILPEAQGQLSEAQANMEDASESVADLTEEANANNEDTNEEIANSKAEFDMYRESVERITQKIQNGEPLTDAEKEFVQEAMVILEDLGIHINDVAETNTDETQDIYDEIEGYQDTFDESAESIEEVQGMVDYAANFDETTKSNAEIVSATAQIGTYGSAAVGLGGLASIAGGIAKLGSVFTTAEGIAMIALGTATAGMGAAATDQFNTLKKEQDEYANIADTEIQVRNFTQDATDTMRDAYDEQIEMYDDNIGIVEDLEMDIPDDLEVPEAPATETVPAGGESDDNTNAGANAGGNVSGTDSNNGSDTSDPQKGKKDVK